MQQLLDNKVTIIHFFESMKIQRKRWPNTFLSMVKFNSWYTFAIQKKHI